MRTKVGQFSNFGIANQIARFFVLAERKKHVQVCTCAMSDFVGYSRCDPRYELMNPRSLTVDSCMTLGTRHRSLAKEGTAPW